ncbi:unnamed protein product [Mytilus coruscus]|uniref:Uncharacterized protein n=1 Tax=Mytilus coruscus TaxID=42192 RepID=A0A6J8A8L1_MYTCO|nr:unnamed protein product [Mytilus coruscus]
MGGEEDLDTLKLEDISTLFKGGCVVLLAAFLFHTIGMATNHWAVSVTDAHGTIQYNGLWEKCADVRLGKGDFECQGFIWSDPQVSHWFRYVQTTEVLAFCAMMIMIAFALLYLFAKFITEDHKKNLKLLALVLGFLSVKWTFLQAGEIKLELGVGFCPYNKYCNNQIQKASFCQSV